MPEFCEGCPLAGSCRGPLDYEVTMEFSQKRPKYSVSLTKCYDENSGESELFHTEVDPDNMLSEIDTCTGPVEVDERIGVFTKKTQPVKICSSLNSRPTILTWYEPSFDNAIKEESGLAVIERELERVESRRYIRHVLIPLGTVAVAGGGVFVAGFLEQNTKLLGGGMWGVVAGGGGIIFATMRGAFKSQVPTENPEL